jgi:site-specific DNA-methyltransferase (adenine-specific)
MEFNINNIKLVNDNNLNVIKGLADNSISIVCIDPPYLYLDHELDIPFEEAIFFMEVKRILCDKGFIIMFGRGESFYRWNTILASIGFKFKEEIIWNRVHNSSPAHQLLRVHETVSLWTLGKGIIHKRRIPYVEARNDNIESVIADIKRLKCILKNEKSLDSVIKFLETNKVEYLDTCKSKHGITVQKKLKDIDRCVKVMASIKNGMMEKSIFREVPNHYTSIHPTEKPIRLIERLLSLVMDNYDSPVVADFFCGSGSTLIASHRLGMPSVGVEVNEKFYSDTVERLENLYMEKNEQIQETV